MLFLLRRNQYDVDADDESGLFIHRVLVIPISVTQW